MKDERAIGFTAAEPGRGARPRARGSGAPPSPGGPPASGEACAVSHSPFRDLLKEILSSSEYGGQLAHVEEIPERPARHERLEPPLPAPLGEALRAQGIEALYSHQAQAVTAARRGENVVVVSGTASGKTLAYNLPVFEEVLRNPDAKAFYLFPTKALAQDQLKGIGRMAAASPELAGRIVAGTYDGDTTPHARRKLRGSGNLILTNPDMLHQGILPHHAKWARFFTSLNTVVLDEIHAYRGIFGSHVANVLRRLRRIAAHYGSNPRFLCSSATIGNPRELAETLLGGPATLVDDDGAPRGRRLFVFWNPGFLDRAHIERRSANVEAKELLVRLVEKGVQTIAFTKARVVAELIYRYAREDLARRGGGLAARLAPYRGGYLPSDRREIERRLFSGELLGVVSTNALELGIDVGGLDASLLVGFPPSIASAWQQAGRAGRSGREAMALVVGYNDPVDQYLMRHPRYFFGQSPEDAVLDPGNPYVLAGQVACAAFELPLCAGDETLFGPLAAPIAGLLEEQGKLKELDGLRYWSSTETPSRGVDLRTISDDTYTIHEVEPHAAKDARNRVIGNVDAVSALELVYPEAVYLHEGETYFVRELDLVNKIAVVERREVDYYTQPVLDSHIRLDRERERRAWRGETVCLGDATVTWATVAFKKVRFLQLDAIGYTTLDLPPFTLPTHSLWLAPSEAALAALRRAGRNPWEGLSGIRNLLVNLLPLYVMGEKSDLGGILDSKNLGRPAIFLFDRYPGGIGFAEKAYERFDEVMRGCLSLLSECPCESGCPSCVGLPILRPAQQQDPDLWGGWPIPDKETTRLLLETLLGAGG
jgi:DEAD/DEAH box helicase domain-containing protein